MGIAKRDLERHESLVSIAKGILHKSGACRKCDFHGVYISEDDSAAEKKAYMLGATMINKGEIDASHKQMQEAIKEAIMDLCESCYSCEKIRHE